MRRTVPRLSATARPHRAASATAPRRTVATVAVACALMLLAGAAARAGEAPANDPAAELLAADRAFAALSEETDAKTAFAAWLAPDAIMLPRAGEAVEGHAAAIAAFGDDAGYALHWQPQFAEVAASGDLGWTWGRYQVRVDGAEVSRGKYVNIWKRQPDGGWKVRLDMGNQEPPKTSD